MEVNYKPTGHIVEIPGSLDRIPEFDSRSGDHFWIMTGLWTVSPEKLAKGETDQLDHENMVNLVGPGCYYCEKIYTPLLFHRRCTGPV